VNLFLQVGGSTSHVSIALATAYPKLRFIVQDLPDTIANSHNLLSQLPESVRSRISCQPYNFFTPQPVNDADVYLMRMILHDWPITEATTILRNLLPALKSKPDSRLIIMDTVLPDPGSIPASEESLLRVRDLTMIQAFNSKERELSDWKELFARVTEEEDDGGKLVLKSVTKPFGSVMSVMEVVYINEKDVGTEHVGTSNGTAASSFGTAAANQNGEASTLMTNGN
jgi:6-hydroxytryprostatin B O-methyltransferase